MHPPENKENFAQHFCVISEIEKKYCDSHREESKTLFPRVTEGKCLKMTLQKESSSQLDRMEGGRQRCLRAFISSSKIGPKTGKPRKSLQLGI